MKELKCPYQPCGTNRNCVGCSLDPQKRNMTYEEFREEKCHWNCDDCKHCNPKADMEGIKSPCKRLDHKHFSFGKAVFYSYDCGQRNGFVCSDFEPVNWSLWLTRHYRPEFIIQKGKEIKDNATMTICIDHDWEVRYQVWAKDFFYNRFIDDKGNLKWIRKGYTKIDRKSPIGYTYVYEYPDGYIQKGANAPILYEHINSTYGE